MPMFGTTSMKPAGSLTFAINSNARESSWLKSTVVGFNAVHYSLPSVNGNSIDITNQFYRIDPYFTINFKPKKARSFFSNSVTLRYNYVGEISTMECDGNCDSVILSTTNTTNSFIDLNYVLTNKNTLTPYNAHVDVRYGPSFMTLLTDFQVTRVLNAKKKKITARAYFGTFLMNDSNNPRYNLRADGYRGYYDYTYATMYGGRFENEGFWSHQFAEGYANFKTPTAYAQSNKWNAGVNLYCDLPIPFFKVFADFAMGQTQVFSNGNLSTEIQTISDAGLYCNIGGFMNIYLPLYVSKNILDEYKVNDYKFSRRIRFTLDLKKMTPKNTAKGLGLF
jgi:hypothetical protein